MIGRVRHFYMDRGRFGRFKRHTSEQPGGQKCAVCGRLVIRGMGRWWER